MDDRVNAELQAKVRAGRRGGSEPSPCDRHHVGDLLGLDPLGPFDLSAADNTNIYLEFRYDGTDANFIGLYIDDVVVTQNWAVFHNHCMNRTTVAFFGRLPFLLEAIQGQRPGPIPARPNGPGIG